MFERRALAGEVFVQLVGRFVQPARSAQDPGADVAGQARQYGVVVLAAEGHAHQPSPVAARSSSPSGLSTVW